MTQYELNHTGAFAMAAHKYVAGTLAAETRQLVKKTSPFVCSMDSLADASLSRPLEILYSEARCKAPLLLTLLDKAMGIEEIHGDRDRDQNLEDADPLVVHPPARTKHTVGCVRLGWNLLNKSPMLPKLMQMMSPLVGGEEFEVEEEVEDDQPDDDNDVEQQEDDSGIGFNDEVPDDVVINEF